MNLDDLRDHPRVLRVSREHHAAHCQYTGKPLHDLEVVDVSVDPADRWGRLGSPVLHGITLPRGFEYHSGGAAFWRYVRRAKPTGGCKRCAYEPNVELAGARWFVEVAVTSASTSSSRSHPGDPAEFVITTLLLEGRRDLDMIERVSDRYLDRLENTPEVLALVEAADEAIQQDRYERALGYGDEEYAA